MEKGRESRFERERVELIEVERRRRFSKLKTQMLISRESFLRPHLGDNMSAGKTDVSLQGLFFNHVRTYWATGISSHGHRRGLHRPALVY